MSADMSDLSISSVDDRVRDSLLASGRLTQEDIEKIFTLMQSTSASFGNAAQELGLITHTDLAELIEYASKYGVRVGDSIVESALRRQSVGRSLPVRYTKIVKAGGALVLANRPECQFAEQIRALRAELQLRGATSISGTTLCVLSPCAGDGRTQLSAELAIAFAQTGCRTLLVDADLRRPRLHHLFPSDNTNGLSQALSGGTSSLYLGIENQPNLSLLLSGSTNANPSGVLTSGNLERLVREWRKKYQIVILDTPAINEYADGLTIASQAEQILMVSRANLTPHKSMKEVLRRLAGNQSRIVGAVFNKF